MNILFVTYHFWPPKFGGELLISIERFESLVQRGHQITVLTSGAPGYPDYETVNGFNIYRSPLFHSSIIGRGFRRLFFPFWVLQKMHKINFNIMHLSGTGGVGSFTSNLGNWMTCLAAKKKGAKLVCVHSLADTEHEMYAEEGLGLKLRKLYLNKMDAIVSVGPALYESIRQFYPVSSRYIANGVRDDLFSPLPRIKRNRVRSEKGVSEDQILFTFLGSVGERKGFDILAKVFLKLEGKYQNWRLWVIGPYTKNDNQNIDDSEISSLLKNIRNLSSKVNFLGRVNDRQQLADLLGASDVFVFPTRKEGMPLAPLEAMAAGVPVIISRIPGVTDLANIEGQTGLFVNAGDSQSLESAMIKLGINQKLRIKMGKAAKKRIQTGFGWEDHISHWEKLYRELADQ